MKKIMWRCKSTISGFSGCELESRADLEEALSFFKPSNYVIVIYNEAGIVDLDVYGGDTSLKVDVEADVRIMPRLLVDSLWLLPPDT